MANELKVVGLRPDKTGKCVSQKWRLQIDVGHLIGLKIREKSPSSWGFLVQGQGQDY